MKEASETPSDGPQTAAARLVATFLFGVAAFGILGLVHGVRDSRTIAESQINRRVQVERRGDDLVLVYRCEDFARTYFVDTNRLQPSGLMMESPSNNTRDSVADFLNRHKDFFIAFVGGSSGILTLSSLTKMSISRNSGKRKNFVALVIGALSGYSVGSWAGRRLSTGCDSLMVRKTLAKEQFWRDLEKVYILTAFRSVVVMHPEKYSSTPELQTRSLADYGFRSRRIREPLFECDGLHFVKRARGLELRMEEADFDPSERDFEEVRNFGLIYEKVAAQKGYTNALLSRMDHVVAGGIVDLLSSRSDQGADYKRGWSEYQVGVCSYLEKVLKAIVDQSPAALGSWEPLAGRSEN